MSRDGWISFFSILGGLLLLLGGGALPAHLRSVDREVLEMAARDTRGLVDVAEAELAEERLGTARLLLEAARSAQPSAATDLDERLARLGDLEERAPARARWGGVSPWLDQRVGEYVPKSAVRGHAVLQWMLPQPVRQALNRSLAVSSDPTVMAMLACRQLKETSIFSPVGSAAGQPLEAALLTGASLAEVGRLHAGLARELERVATAAVQGKGTLPLENGLLDLLSAARRLDWHQLGALTERCETLAALHLLVAAAGETGAQWPVLLSAVMLHSGASAVATFAERHGGSGLVDLRRTMALGSGALEELLKQGHRVHEPTWRPRLLAMVKLSEFADWLARATWRGPLIALSVKYLLWADGLFLLFLGLWHGRREFMDDTNRRFTPRPDLRSLFVLTGTASIVLFLATERLLVLKSGPGASSPSAARLVASFQPRLRFQIPQAKTTVMNEKILVMLLAFFVIQLAVYLIGLSRVRQIRNQRVEGSVKMKLLDNEESMFDAPLYIGIGGSVLALVLRLTGYDEISLMASYSSTLFGILFCFLLKVVHVRPYKQRLILEAAHAGASTE